MSSPRVICASRGTELTWKIRLGETTYRMLQNNPDPSLLSVLGIDEDHIQNDIVTNVNLALNLQTTISFDTEDDLQLLADEPPVSAMDVIVPASGVPYGEIHPEISGLNTVGGFAGYALSKDGDVQT